jgi:hypothetical protein
MSKKIDVTLIPRYEVNVQFNMKEFGQPSLKPSVKQDYKFIGVPYSQPLIFSAVIGLITKLIVMQINSILQFSEANGLSIFFSAVNGLITKLIVTKINSIL